MSRVTDSIRESVAAVTAPSVPAVLATSAADATADAAEDELLPTLAAADQLRRLRKRQERLEATIAEIGQALSVALKGDMHAALIDEDGFPRSDIDIHSVTLLRRRRAELQNDHRALMGRVEKALFAYHRELKEEAAAEKATSASVTSTAVAAGPPAAATATAAAAGGTSMSSTARQSAAPPREEELDETPIFEVRTVAPQSPAFASDLREGDLITSFGSVRVPSTTALGAVVANSLDMPIRVRLLRGPNRSRVVINLVPRKWAGRGTVGALFVPI